MKKRRKLDKLIMRLRCAFSCIGIKKSSKKISWIKMWIKKEN
jgi:hypothetical protein